MQQSRDIIKNYADHNDPEIIEREIDAAIHDEAERGALLCEQLARIHELGAAKTRKDGSYQGGWLGRQTFVKPNWEKLAQCQDGAAHSLRVVADCIRKGYDPRKLEPDPNEKIDIWRPCDRCTAPMDCASWKSCERGLSDDMRYAYPLDTCTH